MRRILVTAISGNIANGILKILQETEDEVFGCDINEFPVGMDKVTAYWQSDLAVHPNYIDNLILKCEEYKITHLIPANEVEVEVISQNMSRFSAIGEKGITVLINSLYIVDNFLNKYKTYQLLDALPGISVPKTFCRRDFVADGKQYMVKLKQSCGSKYLCLVSSERELDSIDFSENEYVIQEYIEDEQEEYTVGVFSDEVQVYTIIFKRKLEHGYTSFVELVHDTKIDEEARVIAKAIGLKGYINIQLRKRDGKNYIFEINPRISGTVYFRHLLGFKDVIWWLDLLDGKQVTYEPQYSKAIGMRELSEKFLVMEKIGKSSNADF